MPCADSSLRVTRVSSQAMASAARNTRQCPQRYIGCISDGSGDKVKAGVRFT